MMIRRAAAVLLADIALLPGTHATNPVDVWCNAWQDDLERCAARATQFGMAVAASRVAARCQERCFQHAQKVFAGP